MKAAAVSLLRKDDKILCVWNKRYGCWSLPGGMVEEGEDTRHAQRRELLEETGCITSYSRACYEGPVSLADHIDENRASFVYLFDVDFDGGPQEMESGCPVTWFTREEFLKWTKFSDFYRRAFDYIDFQKKLLSTITG